MHELKVFNRKVIPVYETDEGNKVVYGRELHERLSISKKYTDWMDSMIAYGFLEETDYQEFWEKDSDPKMGNAQFISPQQAAAYGYSKNHLLSADMAKHIAMIQRTPEGKSIRQKLIDLEKAPKAAGAAQVTFKDIAEAIPMIADDLHLNSVGKLVMYKGLCKDYGVPTGFLPDYVDGGAREAKPVTELLKQFGYPVSAMMFNRKLLNNGILEERTRKSTSKKGGISKYKALTESGLKYGVNQVSPQNPKETQPYYYVDTFQELYDLVS